MCIYNIYITHVFQLSNTYSILYVYIRSMIQQELSHFFVTINIGLH